MSQSKRDHQNRDDDEVGFTPPVSRRGFMFGVIGSGVLAPGSAVIDREFEIDDPGARAPRLRERVERIVPLKVNGKRRWVGIEDREYLVDTLRYKLGLTGTKLGCHRGTCGSCSVLLDGEPRYACKTFTIDAVNKDVQTIEGLSQGGLHPLQKAFRDEQGFQCAYCTPGMILTAKALLEENADPTRQEIREALYGNLCRCGHYKKIIDAVQTGARNA